MPVVAPVSTTVLPLRFITLPSAPRERPAVPGTLAAHRGPGRQLSGHRDRCPRRYPNRMTEPAKTPPAGHPEAGSDLPGTGRTEAFSDGVFAIVITLLVLDLTNPHYRPGGLGAALARQWPS